MEVAFVFNCLFKAADVQKRSKRVAYVHNSGIKVSYVKNCATKFARSIVQSKFIYPHLCDECYLCPSAKVAFVYNRTINAAYI